MELEEAREALVRELKQILECETVMLPDAVGRILADDLRAPFSVPSFPKAAMDGYAVRSSDVSDATIDDPVMLKVIGESLAGTRMERYTEADTFPSAVRIMTGARVPDGYDTVIRQEDTDYGEDTVSIRKGEKPYANYCKVGEDISKGQTVLKAGRRIGRTESGVLASLGIDRVTVIRPLRVSVIATGSELKDVGSKLGDCEIYNSIAYMIEAALCDPQFEVTREICPDDEQELKTRILKAVEESDIVITTGGVSVGKKDLIPDVLDDIGAKKIFARVNVQPGTPTIGSILDGVAILSLSGNPYAAIANYDYYFGTITAALTGCDAYKQIKETAVLISEYPKVNKHRRLLRAFVCNGEVSLPVKSHASSVLSNMLDCNCYIDLPAGTSVSPGDKVNILRI